MKNGVVVDFEVEGDFPKYGNNDDRVDTLAVDLLKRFMTKVKKHPNLPQCATHYFYLNHHF